MLVLLLLLLLLCWEGRGKSGRAAGVRQDRAAKEWKATGLARFQGGIPSSKARVWAASTGHNSYFLASLSPPFVYLGGKEQAETPLWACFKLNRP